MSTDHPPFWIVDRAESRRNDAVLAAEYHANIVMSRVETDDQSQSFATVASHLRATAHMLGEASRSFDVLKFLSDEEAALQVEKYAWKQNRPPIRWAMDSLRGMMLRCRQAVDARAARVGSSTERVFRIVFQKEHPNTVLVMDCNFIEELMALRLRPIYAGLASVSQAHKDLLDALDAFDNRFNPLTHPPRSYVDDELINMCFDEAVERELFPNLVALVQKYPLGAPRSRSLGERTGWAGGW